MSVAHLPTPSESLTELLAVTCRVAGVRVEEVASRSRHRLVVSTRRAFVKLAKTLPKFLLGHCTPSYPEIARAMGAPAHSTAITAAQYFEVDETAKSIYTSVCIALMDDFEAAPKDHPIAGEFTSGRDAASYLFVLAGYRTNDITPRHYKDLVASRAALAMLAAQATRKSEHPASAARVRRAQVLILQEGIQCESPTSSSSTSATASSSPTPSS